MEICFGSEKVFQSISISFFSSLKKKIEDNEWESQTVFKKKISEYGADFSLVTEGFVLKEISVI